VKIYRVFQGDLPYFSMILRYIGMIEKYLYLEFNSYGAMARTIQINIIINSCVCLVYSA